MNWEGVKDPSALRLLALDELASVANEVRAFLLKVIPEQGGHFASNLGTVELTVALHYVFQTPEDKLVWDVGHQAYAHKVLTGRGDRLASIRQLGGLSGFTHRDESVYDSFGAGHASTSISAALGIAQAMVDQRNRKAVAILGDGSLTGGLAFEALNHAGHVRAKNLIVVLNDNAMSIDPNVGALAQFINKMVTRARYNRFRRGIASLLARSELKTFGTWAIKVRQGLKMMLTPGSFFESLGFRYLGPFDGHNLRQLVDALECARVYSGGPTVVHVRTVKGKGYALAEKLPIQYHGVSPFSVQHGITPVAEPKRNYQDVFGDTMVSLGRCDPRIVAITAAMPSGTGLLPFQAAFPRRFYDVGIAEAHAVTFAAGLASMGKRPVVAIYSTFLQRAFDSLIHDVALQRLPVIFALDRAGLVGADGATHQGIFDLSYLRCIPHMRIMAPKDEHELAASLRFAVEHAEEGPLALRYPRGEISGHPLPAQITPWEVGRAEVVWGNPAHLPEVLFVASGNAVWRCVETLPLLEKYGVSCALVNARWIKPIDAGLILTWAQKARLLVTVEENTVVGGLGGAVLEMLANREVNVPVLTVGVPDIFVEHGTQKEQRSAVGLNSEALCQAVLGRLKGRVIPHTSRPPLTPGFPKPREFAPWSVLLS